MTLIWEEEDMDYLYGLILAKEDQVFGCCYCTGATVCKQTEMCFFP